MPQRELKIFLVVLSCWAIRQWGLFSLSDDTGGWITFPIAFPNAAFAVDITHYNSTSTAVNIYLEISYVFEKNATFGHHKLLPNAL